MAAHADTPTKTYLRKINWEAEVALARMYWRSDAPRVETKDLNSRGRFDKATYLSLSETGTWNTVHMAL